MRAWLLLFATAVPLLAACGEPELTACTTEARASVSVHVVDAQGEAVTDAKVTFTRDGGASQPAECVYPAGEGCESWVTAWERTGHFVVRAESADGTKHDEAAVDVTEDDCHVQGKTLTLTL
jgi:hypothetical protein